MNPAVLKPAKGERASSAANARPAIGLEAEFSVILDGRPVRPEDVFESPTAIVRAPMMHRTGRSYHLPTGGAVYFDTGVIEIATPVIELETGCSARAGRSLWESIRFLRQELDAWEQRNRRVIHLSGFSAHYNISDERPAETQRPSDRLGWLLTHLVPMPVMLLAANRRSTGIGVRPRVKRVEFTADFTPDAALMIATSTLLVGITRSVMAWPSHELGAIAEHGLPMLRQFRPEPHSSRRGWVARFSSFSENPFAADVDAPIWELTTGERLSMRRIARRITNYFWPSIAAYGDQRSLRLIRSVMNGRTPSLLELEDRPASYERVGSLCTWADLFPVRALPRSRYEQVFIRAIARRKLLLGDQVYTPIGMRGWSHVIFQRAGDRSKHAFSLDFLLSHLAEWAVGPRAGRRAATRLRDRIDRRASAS